MEFPGVICITHLSLLKIEFCGRHYRCRFLKLMAKEFIYYSQSEAQKHIGLKKCFFTVKRKFHVPKLLQSWIKLNVFSSHFTCPFI